MMSRTFVCPGFRLRIRSPRHPLHRPASLPPSLPVSDVKMGNIQHCFYRWLTLFLFTYFNITSGTSAIRTE